MTLIDILIPTYNRCAPLRENLHLLNRQIGQNNLADQVSIIISDNASPDNTRETVADFAEQHPDIKIIYHRQPANKGLEQNAVDVLLQARSPYVMFLGDDDYLPEGYLAYCIKKTNAATPGFIVPGLANLQADGKVVPGRLEKFDELALTRGFDTMYRYSHLGHQMSGILVRRESLAEDYLKHEQYRTPYLFIYFLAHSMLNHNGYYVPQFKVKVSMGNTKDWSYNQIGLLDEVYKAYYPFIEPLGEKKVARLMLRFTIMHAYRIDFGKGLLHNYRSIVRASRNPAGFRSGLLWLLTKEYLRLRLKGELN